MNKKLYSILVAVSLLLPTFALAVNPEPTHIDGKVENILKTYPAYKSTPKSSVKPKIKTTPKPAVKVKPKATPKPTPKPVFKLKKFLNKLKRK